MSITVWDLCRYVFKRKWIIAAITIFSMLAANIYVSKNQTYSAKVIIKYTDSCIGEGKNLNGKAFDCNEIKSPAVIENVLGELGYSKQKIDFIREKVSVSPLTPKDKTTMKAAKEKLGEEYEYHPDTFVITYKGGSSFETTRDILNSLIKNYFRCYSENYLYLATVTEVDYDINKKSYDYLEQAELIENNIKQTINSLSKYSKDSAGYRSPSTGLTFDDLLKEFETIYDFSVPNVFSKIYGGQVSRDKELLLCKYTERMEQDYRDMDNLAHKASLAEDRMKAYASANENVTNSYGGDASNAKIVGDVDKQYKNSSGKQTTYDTIMLNYTNDSIAANDKKIDAEHCQSVINRFSGNRDGSADYEAVEKDVRNEISGILTELEELYDKSNILIDDYNSYIPARHIKKLSGVGYYENLSVSLYLLIAAIIGFVLSCAGSVGYEIVKKYSFYAKEEKQQARDEHI